MPDQQPLKFNLVVTVCIATLSTLGSGTKVVLDISVICDSELQIISRIIYTILWLEFDLLVIHSNNGCMHAGDLKIIINEIMLFTQIRCLNYMRVTTWMWLGTYWDIYNILFWDTFHTSHKYSNLLVCHNL